MDSLTDDERAMLDLEARWFTTAAAKEEAIRQLGWRPVRYYQQLNRLIQRLDALTHAPIAVYRLNRIRSAAEESRDIPS